MCEFPITDPDFVAAYRKALGKYGGESGVTGVDVGFLYDAEGTRTDEQGVRVHLAAGVPITVFRHEKEFHGDVGGVPISFVRATYRRHHRLQLMDDPGVGREWYANPLSPGVNIAGGANSGGTLGLIVQRRADGAIHLLSNQHVFVDGDAKTVLQPSRAHKAREPENVVATLTDSILDVDGDAAIARFNDSRPLDPVQWGTDVLVTTARMPHLGEKVSKSGARTDVTHGIVDGCGRYYLPAENGLTYREMDGFRVVPEKEGDDLSGFGDSGAVWYSSADRQGVGLHVGGQTAADPRGEHSIACYLPRVLDRLGVDPLKEAPRPFVDAVLRDSAPSFRELAEAVARLADAVERLLHARG